LQRGLLLAICKNDNALDALLEDKPRKDIYRPYPMHDEGVLLLLLIIEELEHI
jgi:hypothetical protein